MLSVFDFARQMDSLGVLVRLVLAVVCGGVIGIEREVKRRPAGFRTHILICLGAAITTLTSQYMYIELHLYTDIARLGAQVIAGVGFIGAGTIIVTKRKRIKGLTTAAGLWTSAIIGLACGAGYVECALFATVMILFAELLLSKIEYALARDRQEANLYIEYSEAKTIDDIIHCIKSEHGVVTDIEITRSDRPDKSYCYCALLSVQTAHKQRISDLITSLRNIEYVKLIDEL